MRVNIYSQEINLEEAPVLITEESNTGIKYCAVRFFMHSSAYLHHPPKDDDRTAVSWWLPKSPEKRERLARQFEEAARQVRAAPINGLD